MSDPCHEDDYFLTFNCINMMKLLDTSDDCVNLKDKDGLTLLHWTVKIGNVYFTKKLLKMGADVNAKSNRGCTPLHMACAGKNEECMDVLLDYKPLLNVKHGDMFSYIHTFLSFGNLLHEKLLERMLREGADPNIQDSNGNTPLHYIVGEIEISRSLTLFRLLIKYNADVNSTDYEGKTPLHIAITHANEKMVDLLLKNDADLSIEDRNGITPLSLSLSRSIITGQIIFVVGKHLITKILCFEHVDMKIVNLFLKFGPFLNFLLKCKSEIPTLKKRISDIHNVTYYDILIAQPRKVEEYLRNPIILESLLIFDESKYLLGNRIVRKFLAGMRRYEAAEKLYKIVVDRFPFIQYLCIEQIMAYFDDIGLKKIENL